MSRPGPFRIWLFEIRWNYHNRHWKPTRQKWKAWLHDLAVYKDTGKTPW